MNQHNNYKNTISIRVLISSNQTNIAIISKLNLSSFHLIGVHWMFPNYLWKFSPHLQIAYLPINLNLIQPFDRSCCSIVPVCWGLQQECADVAHVQCVDVQVMTPANHLFILNIIIQNIFRVWMMRWVKFGAKFYNFFTLFSLVNKLFIVYAKYDVFVTHCESKKCDQYNNNVERIIFWYVLRFLAIWSNEIKPWHKLCAMNVVQFRIFSSISWNYMLNK